MSRPRLYAEILKHSALGLEMGASVIIGLLMGIYLDRLFGTQPWLMFLFLGFGFAAAGKAVFRAVKKGVLMDEDGEDEEDGS